MVAAEMSLLRNETIALSELRLPPSAVMRTSPEMVMWLFSKLSPPLMSASAAWMRTPHWVITTSRSTALLLR